MENSNRYRFVIQTSAILVQASVALIWGSAGPLLPLMMQVFGISQGTAGWFAAVAPLTIAIISVPAGMIAARRSLKSTFAFGAFLQGGGVLALAASTYVPVLLTRVLFAAGTAITGPIATAIAAQWFGTRRLPAVTGVMMSFNNLANAIASVATVPIATIFSWKAPIVAYGAFALTCATLWVIVGRDAPVAPAQTDLSPTHKMDERPDLSFRQVVRHRSTVLLAFAVLGAWCLGNSMGSWLPAYYHEVFKMPLEKASSIMSIVTIGGTVGCIAGGVLPMRVGRRRPFIIVPGIMMGGTALCAVFFNNSLVIYPSVALFGMLGNLQNPTLFTMPMEFPDMSVRSGVVVIAIMQCVGNLGNFVGPLVVGYLVDLTGSFLPGFVVASAASLSLLIAGLMLPETGPKARQAVVPLTD